MYFQHVLQTDIVYNPLICWVGVYANDPKDSFLWKKLWKA